MRVLGVAVVLGVVAVLAVLSVAVVAASGGRVGWGMCVGL